MLFHTVYTKGITWKHISQFYLLTSTSMQLLEAALTVALGAETSTLLWPCQQRPIEIDPGLGPGYSEWDW